MTTPRCHDIGYQPDSTVLFEALRSLPAAVFLDSAAPHSQRGRFDIICADPIIWIDESTENNYTDNSIDYSEILNPFQLLDRQLREYLTPLPPQADIPFCGGIIGYFSYDLGHELIALRHQAERDGELPAMAAGVYGWAVITDHLQRRSYIAAHPATDRQTIDDVIMRLQTHRGRATEPFRLTSAIHANLDSDEYHQRFQRIQEYIRAGDCYQINLARRFEAACEGDPWIAYCRLRGIAAAPYSAFLQLEDSAVLSFSPERFLQVNGRRVQTEPIKGTAPRSGNPTNDQLLADTLVNSEKNRAENLMIVDLLRNDLGKCCEPGSIRADKLFELQTFATVHHLVSTISGTLKADATPLDVLAACFPGGSITGAPKRRAMEIIEELEPHQRSVYCGAIGYISADGKMDTSIAIRTLVCERDRMLCWSGGGIVADSSADDEFQETWNKVGKLLDALAVM